MPSGPTILAPDAYLRHLADDVDRMAAVAERGLDLPVPACTGWTVRDAVVHTGEVFHHKAHTLRLGRWPADDAYPQAPEPGEDPVAWLRQAAKEVVGELQSRDPAAPMKTWDPEDQTVGFWYRRMAQETVVHRVDVEQAHDDVTPVDGALATDGVDEVLVAFMAGDWSDMPVEDAHGRTVDLRAGDARWRVGLSRDRVTVERGGQGPADATVAAPAHDLLLWLWGRCPATRLEVSGDVKVASALRARLVLCTQ